METGNPAAQVRQMDAPLPSPHPTMNSGAGHCRKGLGRRLHGHTRGGPSIIKSGLDSDGAPTSMGWPQSSQESHCSPLLQQ